MSYCSTIYLSAHSLQPQDRKGIFTTRPASKVPGFKKVIKEGLLTQQPACWHSTNKAVATCLSDGESRSTRRKSPASRDNTVLEKIPLSFWQQCKFGHFQIHIQCFRDSVFWSDKLIADTLTDCPCFFRDAHKNTSKNETQSVPRSEDFASLPRW